MKVLQLILFLTLFLFSENHLTDVNQSEKDMVVSIDNLQVINQLGEVIGALLATYTNQIENLLVMLGYNGSIVIAVITLLGFIKGRSITSDIKANKEKIDQFQQQTYKNLQEHKKEIKKEIKEEVLEQIVLLSDEFSQKIEEHAYRRINHKINKLTNEIQERRFSYQKIIYKVNQAKKLEYETVLNSQMTTDEKLEQITIIQSKYNDINNQDIPKLFSKKIKGVVIPAARKLSKIKEVNHVIRKELEKLLGDEDYSFVDREDIREVLEDYYNWKEEKKEN